jgi:hypothetical protein
MGHPKIWKGEAMPKIQTVSKDFSLSSGIFTTANVSLSASTDANAAFAIGTDKPFPGGDIQVGHISVTADTGMVSLNPAEIPAGTSVSFDISASAQSGLGVYGKSADAIAALNLIDPPSLSISDVPGQRYLLMDFGFTVGVSASASQPIGVLGSATFGLDAKGDSTFAMLHRFDASQGANEVMVDSFGSWRLPRHVAMEGADLNIKPQTWLLFELDGSLSLQLGATLGWNINYARELTVLGVTHDISAKIDAGLNATFGFDVSGKYILVVAREGESKTVRLTLSKQSSKGLNFGLNLNVGIQGADPQLPKNFNDLIQAIFGVHGAQVLSDLKQWSDPSSDLGKKIAGLIGDTVPSKLELDLVQTVTGIPAATVAADFDKAKQVVADALKQWDALPDKTSTMLWTFIGQKTSPAAVADFKAFLGVLANPATAKDAIATALQNTMFGDTPQGQFLESIADEGLLSLPDNLGPVSTAAGQVLGILDGSVIQKLQSYINQKLDLDQIRKVANGDFSGVDQWLQNRLANFLDKTLHLDDLKNIQIAITKLDANVEKYYAKAITALTNKYSVNFAATYQNATTSTALIDVLFDMSIPAAAALFAEVAAQSTFDHLLTMNTDGVTLKMGKLTHEIHRKGIVDLHMPLFDFTKTSVNDAMASLEADHLGSGVLLYQLGATDSVTIANRACSQLSLLASLKVAAGAPPQLDGGGSIAYDLREVQAGMRPADLEARTTAFVHQYLGGLFSHGDASLTTFYTDLDIALSAATHSQSNFLGDIALSMELSLPATALRGWFQPRSGSQLTADQMTLSRALQRAWRRALPAMYFQNLNHYLPDEATAALLVWSSMPVAAGMNLISDGKLAVDTGKDIYWDFADVSLRRAVAGSSLAVGALSARLSDINGQLKEAGNSNAGFFQPSQVPQIVQRALNATGDNFLHSLLFAEAEIIGHKSGFLTKPTGATGALEQIAKAISLAPTAPTQTVRLLAQFIAQLTDTFNDKINGVYSGISDRVVGPMLLMEASAALGSTGAKPSARLLLYALNPGHTFQLANFVSGANPSRADFALTQTLVTLT